jgi:histidinol-phosphate/aromatic aminotransferase/cobyric acid decarboxylase-like protein
MSQHAFVVYHLATQVTGAARGARKDFGHDLEAMALRCAATSVVDRQPNNPTGTGQAEALALSSQSAAFGDGSAG